MFCKTDVLNIFAKQNSTAEMKSFFNKSLGTCRQFHCKRTPRASTISANPCFEVKTPFGGNNNNKKIGNFHFHAASVMLKNLQIQ